MCTTCGCGNTSHSHDHSHHHDHDHPHPNQSRIVEVEQSILSHNNQHAAANRQRFQQQGLTAINLLSSPGSGKTTLLTETIDRLKAEEQPIGVIEGDQQTTRDRDRIRETGAQAIQVNTGKGCHLDAHQIGHAVAELNLVDGGYLFIENVGNLVCPASFDLGEQKKVVLLSVTEGEDKPLKYPDMFHVADLVVINKIDLLPYLPFDLDQCCDYIRRINHHAPILTVSAWKGDGMAQWLEWLKDLRQPAASFAALPG